MWPCMRSTGRALAQERSNSRTGRLRFNRTVKLRHMPHAAPQSCHHSWPLSFQKPGRWVNVEVVKAMHVQGVRQIRSPLGRTSCQLIAAHLHISNTRPRPAGSLRLRVFCGAHTTGQVAIYSYVAPINEVLKASIFGPAIQIAVPIRALCSAVAFLIELYWHAAVRCVLPPNQATRRDSDCFIALKFDAKYIRLGGSEQREREVITKIRLNQSHFHTRVAVSC